MKVQLELKEKYTLILTVSVLLVALSIAVASQLDNQVINAYSSNYNFWFNATMFTPGLIVATVLGLVYWGKIGTAMFCSVTVSTILIIESGFEDLMYFLTYRGLPLNSVNWNWMWQAKYIGNGFWCTSEQIMWAIIFLLITAIFLFIMVKIIGKEATKNEVKVSPV